LKKRLFGRGRNRGQDLESWFHGREYG
jgi:hypothetical protein